MVYQIFCIGTLFVEHTFMCNMIYVNNDATMMMAVIVIVIPSMRMPIHGIRCLWLLSTIQCMLLSIFSPFCDARARVRCMQTQIIILFLQTIFFTLRCANLIKQYFGMRKPKIWHKHTQAWVRYSLYTFSHPHSSFTW